MKTKKRPRKLLRVRMTPEQRRVKIAQEVLWALDHGKFNAQRGKYCELQFKPESRSKFEKPEIDPGNVVRDMPKGQQLNTFMARHVKKCEGCAKALLFAAAVRLYNKLEIHTDSNKQFHTDLMSESFLRKYLKQWFSPSQLDLIEFFFENASGGTLYCRGEMVTSKWVAVFNRHWKPLIEIMTTGDLATDKDTTAEACLRLIMNNVIRNYGTFDPRPRQIQL